jgi:hypothetical protein
MAVALALTMVVPGTVAAAWTETTVTENTRFDEPSLALDAGDRAHVAYIGYGDEPGIYVASDATGTWTSARLTDATDDAPAIALDANGHRHIVFVRSGDDPGIHYATDRNGDWTVTRLTSERADSPSIAVDVAGHVHIAFNSDSFEPGVVSLDDSSGSWVRTRVTSAHLDGATSIVVLPDGSTKIAFARYAPEAPGIYVASAATSTGPWTTDRLTSAYDDEPTMAVRSAGAIDLAFVRFAAEGRGLYHASGHEDWSVTPLVVDDDKGFDRPSLAIDRDGLAAIAYARTDSNGDVDGLFLARERADGSWEADRRLTTGGRPDDWPSLALDAAGREHVAFAELDTGPNPGVYVRDPRKFDLLAASTVDSDVSMTDVGDARVIAFKHLAGSGDRGIRTGKRTNGTWAFETASTDPAAPSVVVDDAWHARIFTGDTELSNDTGAWLASTLRFGTRDVRTSRDASGHTWLAYTDGSGDPAIATDGSGSWEAASGYFGGHGEGAVAEGADGRIHWVVAGDTLTYQTAAGLDGPWTEKRLGANAADPAITVDADDNVHIVWRRTTSDEGTYYTTNVTGSWVTTRLTRTSAEGAAALALDAAGRVHVAVVRASWAANPGLYLVSNRTGSWVTTRIDGAFDAMGPQLSVDPSGLATVVLGRLGAGLRALDQTDFSPPTIDRRTSRIHEIDIEDARGRRLDQAGHAADESGSTGPPTVPRDHGTDATP